MEMPGKREEQIKNQIGVERLRSFWERDNNLDSYVNYFEKKLARREPYLLGYIDWRLEEMRMPLEATSAYRAGAMFGYELSCPDFEKIIPFPIRENRIAQIKEVWGIGDYEKYGSLLKQALGEKSAEILGSVEAVRKLLENKGEGMFYFGADETLTVLFWDKINSLINQQNS